MANCDRYRTPEKRREEYRLRQLRRTAGLTVTIGRDDRRTVHRAKTAICERCKLPFEFVMTTKPRRFDPACYAIRERERNQASHKARKAKPRVAAQPSKPLVRYVGFDPTEKPLHHDEGERYD